MSIFRLETFRLIGKTYKRFLSLTLIVFIGAGFMMGLMSTPKIMRESVDRYYDEYDLQDIIIYSTYGFCNEDLRAIENTSGVERVWASKEIDVHGIDKNGLSNVIRVSELYKNINNYRLVDGRLPQKKNECLLYYNDFGGGHQIGDKLTLDYGSNDINEYLNEIEYTIVGLVESPQYLGKMYGASNFNNEEIEGIILIPNGNFISSYYTTMYVMIDGANKLISDTKEYEKYIAENKADLENVVVSQQSYLRDKLISEYGEQLKEKEELFEQVKAEGKRQLDEAKKQLDEANVQITVYESQLTMLDALVKSMEAALKQDSSILNSIYNYTVDVEGDVIDILEILGLEGAHAVSGAMEYSYKEYKNAVAQYNSIRGQLNGAKAQYEAGLKKYTEALVEYNQQIAEGEEQLKLARARLNDLPKSQWIMLDRDLIYSTVMYKDNTLQMESIGLYMPLMFFLVAALVCLTTMKRLVDEQRGQIGIYVALGYSNMQIIGKYVTYALLASLCGGVLGAIVGQFLFPSVLYNTWRMAYYLPKIMISFSIKNLLLSVGSFAVLVCGITAYVVNNMVKDSPASLMRPVAPKKGKELLIEKITFLWNALSFTSKITARNIFRYKARFLMTIAGIAGCAGLLIMGFGIKDSISDVLYIQNTEIFTYDYSVTFEKPEYAKLAMEKLERNSHIEKAVEYGTYVTRVYLDGKEATANAIVIDPEESNYMVHLRETDKKTPIRLGNDGVVVSEKFAKNNNLKKGDTITIESGNRIKQDVTISNICEMYFSHYIFMSDSLYKNVFDEEIGRNKITIQADEDYDLYPEIKDLEGFSNLSVTADTMEKFGTLIGAMNLIIVVIILVAGSLAFVVIVNLTQVNISERIREIATLKVLGFNDFEVNSYIFKEIILLSLIGCVVGIPIGIIEHKFIMSVLNIEMIMYGNRIKFVSFIYSIIITIVFTIIVLMFMRKPLREVDMVESLKSVE